LKYIYFDLASIYSWSMSRICIDPAICHGRPVLKETWILLSNILADLAAGRTYHQVSEDYPGVQPDDIKAVLEFSAELAAFETVDLSTAV